MKNIIFTNTLSSDLMNEIERYKKQTGLTKREVFEKALKGFFISEKKKKMMEDFKKIKQDLEVQEMAEWGIGDYLNQIK